MNREIIWGLLLIAIIISQWFIKTERPVWVYHLEKWSRVGGENDQGGVIYIYSASYFLFIITIITGASNPNPTIRLASVVFAILCIVLYTASSVFNILNALIPPQKKLHAIVTVIDAFTFRLPSRNSPDSYWVLIKASIPGVGIRVLPPIRYDGIEYHPKSNISIFYRQGCFGYLYRFAFDAE